MTDGPASSLFGPDFYQNLHNALTPGGVICTQAESIWLHLPLIQDLHRYARQHYAHVEYAITSVPTYPCGSIGLLVCRKQALGTGATALTSCARPVRPVPQAVTAQLKFYNADLHVAAFAKPTFVNAALANL